jgi:Putative zinc-finger
MMMECTDAKLSLGVYVLGAIEPADRALVDSHLTTCRDCRDELAGLAGLPALLARVSTEEAIALAAIDGPPEAGFDGMPRLPRLGETPVPPPELLATVLDLTAARRRRRRWRDASIGVAAALIIAVGVFGGLRLGSNSGQTPTTASGSLYSGTAGPWQAATGQSGTLAATVSYRSMGWGTELDTVVHGIPIGTQCELYVTDSAGKRIQVGDWITDSAEGTVWYPGSVSLSSKEITSFEVTVGSGKPIEITT